MNLSTLLTSLPLGFEAAVRQAAALGFQHVDVVGLAERPEAHREVLAETGLLVSCAAVGRGLPPGCSLDAESAQDRRTAVDQVRRQIADAARLGATHCYLVPGQDAGAAALTRFTEACVLLADFAGGRMVRLCVEHVPGRALPTVAAALAWLDTAGHANLALLLDVGHCLISGEDPARAADRAGDRLGYVHLDDNDGVNDLHRPLLAGRLTEDMLDAFFSALRRLPYDGAVCLELNPQNPDPVAALREGKALLERRVSGPRTGGA
jgi:sugar phosphate isomerase/epimerase